MTAAAIVRATAAVLALAATGCSTLGGGDTLTDAQQVIADMKSGAAGAAKTDDLVVVGAADHADRRYRAGEPIVLTATVNKPAHLAVLRVLPSGATTLLLPNRVQPASQQAADAPLRIPPAGAPVTIVAAAPGTVLFEFIASGRSDAWLFGRKPAATADFAELGSTTRAIAKDIVASLKSGATSATAFSALTVRITAP